MNDLIHLLKPRGGTQCGQNGLTHVDIDQVTCPRCEEQYYVIIEYRSRGNAPLEGGK